MDAVLEHVGLPPSQVQDKAPKKVPFDLSSYTDEQTTAIFLILFRYKSTPIPVLFCFFLVTDGQTTPVKYRYILLNDYVLFFCYRRTNHPY